MRKMKKSSKDQYREIKVENFIPPTTSGRHRGVATRPIPGQGLSTNLYVQVPTGVTRYPAGAQFLIRAKLTHPKSGRPYLKSYHSWDFTVLRADTNNQTQPKILAEVQRIRRTIKNKTTRKALIDARLGQGRFRSDVGRRWGNKCAVTGCAVSEMLRASHVKPWFDCTNLERLDPSNGLLLVAHIDALFDNGLISFENDGSMLVSDRVAREERRRFRLPANLRSKLTRAEKHFLTFPRRYRFLPE
jgi:HNH endonuclease